MPQRVRSVMLKFCHHKPASCAAAAGTCAAARAAAPPVILHRRQAQAVGFLASATVCSFATTATAAPAGLGWRPMPPAADAAACFGAEATGTDLGTACNGRDRRVGEAESAHLVDLLQERRVVAVRGLVLDSAAAFERICRVFGPSLHPVGH